ncbi:MAG: SH3 domain-containing protein [Anaerolineae bacterium]
MWTFSKRSMLLVLIMALFSLPVIAQTNDTFRVTAPTLNARTGPGIEYDVVARLGAGSSYPIVSYSVTRNWVLLDLGYTQAWAFRHLGRVTSAFQPNSVLTTQPATTTSNGLGALGQGGGFAPPVEIIITQPLVTETGVDLSVTSTSAEFNSTIGVTTNLRMRNAPSSNGRILTVIPFDQRATPLGRTANGTWIQVAYGDTVGWVYFLYVAFPPAIDVRALPVTG